jgi:hypothetical protein
MTPDRLPSMLRTAFERAYRVGHAHGRLSPNSNLPPEPDAIFDFDAEIERLAQSIAAQVPAPVYTVLFRAYPDSDLRDEIKGCFPTWEAACVWLESTSLGPFESAHVMPHIMPARPVPAEGSAEGACVTVATDAPAQDAGAKCVQSM